jgi:Lon protease-like protein
MTAPRRYRNISDLPAVIPVFPLSGALLLPRTRLPLNVFEPRYLAMVDAAMDEYRLIGMIQPRSSGEDKAKPTSPPPLCNVGCVGRITEYSETDDGRYLITLTGIARFHVSGERDSAKPFRQVAADYAAFAADLLSTEDPPIARDRLLRALKPYLSDRAMKTDWKSIEEAPAETLVNALCVLCPFEPSEKQALLEAPGLKERADALITLLEIANASAMPSGGTPSIN